MTKEEKMNTDTAIEVKKLYKSFTVYYDKANTLKERIIRLGKGKKEEREILKDIDLEIKKGEVVALIGVNGSGK